MAKKNGAAKWLASLSSGQARQNYIDGINGTQVNPMQLSADAENLYLARVQESVSSGRRRARLMAVPVSAWKDGATGKGAGRLASGAQAASGKMQAHFQKWDPIYAAASAAAAAVPKDGTMISALARVQAAITVMRQAAGKPT